MVEGLLQHLGNSKASGTALKKKKTQSPKQPSGCTHRTPRTRTHQQCSLLYMWWEETSRLRGDVKAGLGLGPWKHPHTEAARPPQHSHSQSTNQDLLVACATNIDSILVGKWEAQSNFSISVTHVTRKAVFFFCSEVKNTGWGGCFQPLLGTWRG